MNLRAYRTFQALILGGLGIYLFSKVMNGRILLYINQRFVVLVLLAAIGLILMAQLILRERLTLPDEDSQDRPAEDSDHDNRQGWTLWLLALPLLVGLLVPERPLGAGVIEKRGISTTSLFAIQGGATSALDIPSTQRSVLDWIRIGGEVADPAVLVGQPADVTGFVYHDARLGQDQFMVGRFSIACCIADAAAVGLVVDWAEAPGLPDNQWVRVQGPVNIIEMDGNTLVVIKAGSVEPIPQPEQPYLFP